MRLKTIKLAGFKSFVDPTSVHFRSNLSAVVGPNGCGKSNVIDAVRWVMGESSAKTLRGAAMTDVIFNGSTQRAPVGKASIELVFDNADQSLGGSWARFSEISVRREVSRDGQSKYSLNGTVCRRKDVTDLFLGTGLGPRSYAIIEQGMINRFIEARPDELRAYVEEAAGVSRYKERRKETQTRLDRTQDNLDRLADLEDELERHVQHLTRQAEAAKRYQTLGDSIVSTQGKLIAKRWELAHAAYLKNDQELSQIQTSLSDQRVQRDTLRSQGDALRSQYEQVQAEIEQIQGQHYEQGARLARLEQSEKDLKRRLAEQAERLSRLERRHGHVKSDLADAENKQTRAQDTLSAAIESLAQIDQHGPDLETQVAQASEALDELKAKASEARLAVQHEQAQRAQLSRAAIAAEREADQLAARLAQLQSRQPNQPVAVAVVDTTELSEELANLQAEKASLQVVLESAEAGLRNWRGEQTRLMAELNQLERSWQKLARLIENLNKDVDRPLLARIDVKPDQSWLGAALGPLASAEHYETFDDMPWPPQGNSVWGKVPSDWAEHPWLRGAMPVDSLEQARAELFNLSASQCLVTPQGVLVGRQFVLTQVADSQGPLLKAQLAELDTERVAVEVALETHAASQPKDDPALLKARLSELNARESKRRQSLQKAQADVERHAALSERYEAEMTRYRESEQQLLADHESAQVKAAQLRSEFDGSQPVGEVEIPSTAQAERQLTSARQQYKTWQAQRAQAEIDKVRAEGGLAQAQSDWARLADEFQRVDHSLSQFTQELSQDSVENVSRDLEAQRTLHAVSQTKLSEKRADLMQCDQQLRALDGQVSALDQGIEQQAQALSHLQAELARVYEQRKAQAEQLASLGFELSELSSWDLSSSETQLAVEVERLEKAQQRLGAVNLAALEELEASRNRQAYYQAQRADLEEAIATLEEAVRKIDRETRNLFNNTFNTLNDSLKALFPKVFGGGEAWLELTEDDALTAGVVLMARPPGKRNSTIHLLSGGEKALTAVALVFSIFQLSPAPFCMLDEVDAPLDDANVGRYAQLLDEMSKTVQFIFITHNKLAMERAQQLLGVTMQEPGVSRLVSVDVDQAMQLAELE